MRQFASYLLVGGLATVVEWTIYYVLDPVLNWNTYAAVAISFLFSTFANWAAGRAMTFRHAAKQNLVLELGKIYLTSLIGLGLNELIMFACMHWVFHNPGDMEKFLSKVLATAIVFFYNFAVRKYLIYKNKK